MSEHQVQIDVRVHSLDTLYRAARERAKEENLSPELADEVLLSDGKPNPEACLIMMLDPGTLEGCEIHETDVITLPED